MKVTALLFAMVSLTFLLDSYQGSAQVSFFQPPTFAGAAAASPRPPFVADFNGDGKPDILATDGTMNLGNGDGTFKAGKAVSGTPLAVADFNGDGKPDILQQSTGTLLVLLGNGDGTFQAPISTASGAALTLVEAADLNGDHKADVVGVWNTSLYVYISNGDGTFKAGVPYSPGIASATVVLSFGDFNNDQKVDIALSISDSNGVGQEIVMFGNGDGTFQQTTKVSTGVSGPQLGVVGDFNGDGKLDLALEGPKFVNPVPPVVYILLGNGDGTFQTPILAITGSGPLLTQPVAQLGAADLNGDGKLDLVLGTSPVVAQVYLGNGDGTFTNSSNYLLCLNGGISGIAVADFNTDGKPDITGCNAILLGNGNGTFQGWPLLILPDGAGAAVVGRFDKAGNPGIAVLSGTNVDILSGDSTGTLSLVHTYPIPPDGAFGILTADLNGDGNLDLVTIEWDGSPGTWGYSVLLGNGDNSFQAPVFYPQGSASANFQPAAVIADFNNDHKPDLAVAGLTTGTLGIFLGNGDGTFASPVSYFDADFGPLLVADFNSDGKLDIAASGVDSTDTLKTLIMFGNGDGTFQAAVFPSSLNNFRASLTADVNNDGTPDLVSINDQVALGNGDGTFTMLSPPLTCPWGGWLGEAPCFITAVADLNGDGKPDLFVGEGAMRVFQSGFQVGNGDGTFAPPMAFPTIGDVPLVSIGDVNGDSRPDLIFAWSTTTDPPSIYTFSGVGVILNTTTPDFTIGPASGSPTSQTISAGQSASFKLAFGAISSFSGTVNLSCAITPVVTPAPTCNLSNSSVQISAASSQTVTVNVGTTASTTTGAGHRMALPPRAMLTAFMLSGLALLFARGRRWLPALATPAMAIALALCMSCGSGSSHHTTQGTPAGNYSATVTASSGGLTHSMSLQVIVQ